MAKQKYIVDPDDGMRAEIVGRWVSDQKHERLKKYINASRGARAKYRVSSYIDLFCGPGRINIKDTNNFKDGGALIACKMAREGGSPFSKVYVNDLDPKNADPCRLRLKSIGDHVLKYNERADQAVTKIVDNLDPGGLHFAYLDPYNFEGLPFAIVEKLARLKRMDMIIHVSAMDLRRNLEKYIANEVSPLDGFAPGWREVASKYPKANKEMRAAILDHWLNLVRNLGMHPSNAMEMVTADQGQELYWLMFVSRNNLADRLWREISNLTPQLKLI